MDLPIAALLAASLALIFWLTGTRIEARETYREMTVIVPSQGPLPPDASRAPRGDGSRFGSANAPDENDDDDPDDGSFDPPDPIPA
jgi:hypothetical protein